MQKINKSELTLTRSYLEVPVQLPDDECPEGDAIHLPDDECPEGDIMIHYNEHCIEDDSLWTMRAVVDQCPDLILHN